MDRRPALRSQPPSSRLLTAALVALGACSSGDPSGDAAVRASGVTDGGPGAAVPILDAALEHPDNCVPTGPEICDGKDNDCDGTVDNGFTWQGLSVGSHCYPGLGGCGVTGTVICASPTSATCSAMPGMPDDSFHSSAAPNGSWDWNCNNGVDRQYPLSSCETAAAASCPTNGWTPKPGEAGDCGQMLVQRACSADASGCVSTGPAQLVIEACK